MRVSDEQIISAMLASPTNKAAAAAVNLSERSFYQRTRTQEFREKMDQVKAEILESATNRAESRLSDAVDTMCSIMADETNAAQVRLSASDALIRNALKMMELVDVEKRLNQIETAMKEFDR